MPQQVTIEQILRDHGTRIYSLARRMLGHAEDAEDVTQEVLLKVHQHIDQFRGGAALSTWIYRITVSQALRFRKRRARRPLLVADSLEDFPEDGRHAHPNAPCKNSATRATTLQTVCSADEP